MTFIVVLGLVVVVILVVVLVALGMRANRAARDDSDPWADEDQARRAGPGENSLDDGYDNTGYDNAGYDNAGFDNAGYDNAGYDTGGNDGYDNAEPDGSGYDRRVAGAPLAAPTPAAPVASRPGRATDEMADDDYWATITFDKPKFPWQHDKNSAEPERVLADDPLGTHEDEPLPAEAAPAATMTQPDGDMFTTGPRSGDFRPGGDPLSGEQRQHAGDPLSYGDPLSSGPLSPGGPPSGPQTRPAMSPSFAPDPLDLSIPQQSGAHAPLPLHASDPLGIPVVRAENREHEATQAFSAEGIGGYGDNPLGMPSAGAPMPPAATPPPLAPAQGGSVPAQGGSVPAGSAADLDPNRLPTVDELLQRIQTDRQRSGAPDLSSSFGDSGSSSSSYGDATPSYGDPLSDPLSSSGDSYGSGGAGSWSSGSAPGYESDPLRTVSDDSAGRLSGGGLSGGQPGGYSTGGQSAGDGYGAAASGRPSYSGDGYPSAPAYGDAPRYDSPLGGYESGGAGGNGRDYGPFGGGIGESSTSAPLSAPPSSGQGTGENRYGDYAPGGGDYTPGGGDYSGGNGYTGGSDPLGQSGYDSQTGGPRPGYAAGSNYYGSEGGGYDPAASPSGDYDPNSSYGPPYPPAPGPSSPAPSSPADKPSEDWDNYRGFRS